MPKMSPLWLLKYLPNMPASHLAIYNDLRGPNNSLTLREAAANIALGEAFQIIVRGSADAMLVGATGTRLHAMKIVHALQQEELACGNGDPTRLSRPFDLHRSGMVLGRGGRGGDAGRIGRGPGPRRDDLRRGGRRSDQLGRRRAIGRPARAGHHQCVAGRAASGRTPSRTRSGHLHAHGLSTRSCDVEEARAIQASLAAGPPAAGRGRQELLRQPGGRRRHGRIDRQSDGHEDGHLSPR